MEAYAFQIITSLFLCLIGWTSGEECDALSTISTQYLGKRMKADNVIYSMKTSTDSECARQCKLFGFCRSFSYGDSADQCDLNGKDSIESPDDIKEADGFDYYDIAEWPEEIAGGCAGHLCQADEMCVPGPQQSALCVNAHEFMDQKKNECSSSPCKNGGVCDDIVNRYTCSCPTGWRGLNCDRAVNRCRSNPCENGGTCTDLWSDFSCNCPNGFQGKTCTESA